MPHRISQPPAAKASKRQHHGDNCRQCVGGQYTHVARPMIASATKAPFGLPGYPDIQ